MKLEKGPQLLKQTDLDFRSEAEKEEHRKSLIRSIQRKRLTQEKYTPEEEDLIHVLAEEEKKDDQDYHFH